jgi:hypothetical protein
MLNKHGFDRAEGSITDNVDSEIKLHSPSNLLLHPSHLPTL